VLEDVENEDSVIPEINPSNYEKLKEEGKIFQGMIPKLDNAFSAIQKGVKSSTYLTGRRSFFFNFNQKSLWNKNYCIMKWKIYIRRY
jgi:acetylglutamate kinase